MNGVAHALDLLRDCNWCVAGMPSVDQEVDRRYKEHGDDDGDGEAADEGTSERCVLLAARFKAERQRNHAEEGSEGRHENGAHADLAGVHDGIKQTAALSMKNASELDDEDRV